MSSRRRRKRNSTSSSDTDTPSLKRTRTSSPSPSPPPSIPPPATPEIEANVTAAFKKQPEVAAAVLSSLRRSRRFKAPAWAAKRRKARRGIRPKTVKQLVALEAKREMPAGAVTFASVEAGPSALPAVKYCDLSGYRGRYVDPNTRLRYAHAGLYQVIAKLHPDTVKAYLKARDDDRSIE